MKNKKSISLKYIKSKNFSRRNLFLGLVNDPQFQTYYNLKKIIRK